MYYSYIKAANKIAELIKSGTLKINGPCNILLIYDRQGMPNNVTIRCNKDLNPQMCWEEKYYEPVPWNRFIPSWTYSCDSKPFMQIIDSVDKGILKAKYGKALFIESRYSGEDKKCIDIPEQGIIVNEGYV